MNTQRERVIECKSVFFFSSLCLSVLCSFPCFAVKNIANAITPVVGYRGDSIKWKTKKGDSGQWKNLSFIDYGVKGTTTLKDRYVLSYELTLANLVSGTYQDKHYLNPAETSSTSAKQFWSVAFRPNLGLGYKFKPARYFHFIPQVGFVYDLFYLQTSTSSSGPISAFKDTIQWYGPWFGFDSVIKITQRWTMNIAGAYQIAFYNASGNWEIPPSSSHNNLRQSGTGQGASGRIRLQYEVVKSVSLGAEANMGWQGLNSGNDKRSFADGPTIKSKLTNVTSKTFGGRLVLTKSF